MHPVLTRLFDVVQADAMCASFRRHLLAARGVTAELGPGPEVRALLTFAAVKVYEVPCEEGATAGLFRFAPLSADGVVVLC